MAANGKDQEHLCPWSFKKSFIFYPESTSIILKYRFCRLTVFFFRARRLIVDLSQNSAGIYLKLVSVAVLHRRIL